MKIIQSKTIAFIVVSMLTHYSASVAMLARVGRSVQRGAIPLLRHQAPAIHPLCLPGDKIHEKHRLFQLKPFNSAAGELSSWRAIGAGCHTLVGHENIVYRDPKLLINRIIDQYGEAIPFEEIDHISIDRTPFLHVLIEFADCVKKELEIILMSHSVNVNIINPHTGDTPLHYAVCKADYDLCRLLINAGADPNVVNLHTGKAPLHYAICKEDYGLCELLINAGADPNVINPKNGYTALHYVYRSIKRPEKFLKLLFVAGASPDIPNNKGALPHELRPWGLCDIVNTGAVIPCFF